MAIAQSLNIRFVIPLKQKDKSYCAGYVQSLQMIRELKTWTINTGMFTDQYIWFKGTKLEIITWDMQLCEYNHFLYTADKVVCPSFQ